MQKIVPFLWFNEEAEEAMAFYTSLFKNSTIDNITRYGEEVPGPKGKVITATFHLAGLELMALNGGPEFKFTPAISFMVNCQTEEELDELWKNLSTGGSVLMELQQYPFSDKFGWLVDRYGLSWQLNLTRLAQEITPYLLFVGEQNGRAKEAANFYTTLFENSSVDPVAAEGAAMPTSFTLAGQKFLAFDGGPGHDFTFTHAVSFFVNCTTQAEVDYFWEALSQGGEQEPCGWVRDRYGVSWQIVPTVLGELMSDPDAEKAGRVTHAMLQMTKLDIRQLQEAYDQG